MRISADQYASLFVPGPGVYTSVIVQDWTLRDISGELVRAVPSRGADTLVADYIRRSIRPSVNFLRTAEIPPPTIGIPARPGSEGRPVPAKKGVIHIEIVHLLRRDEGGGPAGSVPQVGIWGDPDQVGVHHVLLDRPAPGDIPCPGHCRTADQAFAAVKGRIDIIIRNIKP